MSSVLRQVEGLGGVHAFIVVIKAGQSRYCPDVTLVYKDDQARAGTAHMSLWCKRLTRPKKVLHRCHLGVHG